MTDEPNASHGRLESGSSRPQDVSSSTRGNLIRNCDRDRQKSHRILKDRVIVEISVGEITYRQIHEHLEHEISFSDLPSAIPATNDGSLPRIPSSGAVVGPKSSLGPIQSGLSGSQGQSSSSDSMLVRDPDPDRLESHSPSPGPAAEETPSNEGSTQQIHDHSQNSNDIQPLTKPSTPTPVTERKPIEQVLQPVSLTRVELYVPGLCCDNHEKILTRQLKDVKGVTDVSTNQALKKVVVDGSDLNMADVLKRAQLKKRDESVLWEKRPHRRCTSTIPYFLHTLTSY